MFPFAYKKVQEAAASSSNNGPNNSKQNNPTPPPPPRMQQPPRPSSAANSHNAATGNAPFYTQPASHAASGSLQYAPAQNYANAPPLPMSSSSTSSAQMPFRLPTPVDAEINWEFLTRCTTLDELRTFLHESKILEVVQRSTVVSTKSEQLVQRAATNDKLYAAIKEREKALASHESSLNAGRQKAALLAEECDALRQSISQLSYKASLPFLRAKLQEERTKLQASCDALERKLADKQMGMEDFVARYKKVRSLHNQVALKIESMEDLVRMRHGTIPRFAS